MSRERGSVRLWVSIAVVAVFIGAVFVYDQSRPAAEKNIHTRGEAWNSNMLLGKSDAPNKFVEYTDYFCSFCEQVQAVTGEQFKKDYIDTGKLSFENRIVTLLKDVSPNTEQGAETAFCAADQGKYWEYSHHLVPRIKADYYDKGIGLKNVANPVPIAKLPLDYFSTSASAVGIDVPKFEDCVKNETHKAEIEENTQKALRMGVNGLPKMVVNDYETSGFMGGYDSLKMTLKAGGVE